jgi:hypothetical protein
MSSWSRSIYRYVRERANQRTLRFCIITGLQSDKYFITRIAGDRKSQAYVFHFKARLRVRGLAQAFFNQFRC